MSPRRGCAARNGFESATAVGTCLADRQCFSVACEIYSRCEAVAGSGRVRKTVTFILLCKAHCPSAGTRGTILPFIIAKPPVRGRFALPRVRNYPGNHALIDGFGVGQLRAISLQVEQG